MNDNSLSAQDLSHEVPTHIDTPDVVIFGLTMPQAATAFGGTTAAAFIGYNLKDYLPIHYALGIAAAIWLVIMGGIMLKFGSRSVIAIITDFAQFHLASKRYRGYMAEMRVKSESPQSSPRDDGVDLSSLSLAETVPYLVKDAGLKAKTAFAKITGRIRGAPPTQN